MSAQPRDAGAGHVVLLGDSVFDNGAYVGSAPDVVRQLRRALAEPWKATLLAVDGGVADSVSRQLAGLPADASLLVVSAGGNDALGEAYLLQQRASSVGEAVMILAEAQSRFGERYHAMLDTLAETGLPTAVCTIYGGNFPAAEARVLSAALSLFNDVITRAAFARRLALIDLRLICSEPEDYANPIEPSERGGEKIAAAIADLAVEVGGYPRRSVVIAP